MADDLDPVREEFIADAQDFIDEVKRARDGAAEFADATQAAKDEAGSLRDGLTEAAIAAGIYRDEMGRLRDAQGRFASQAELAAVEMGHVRDKAAEAAVSVKELGKQADDTAAKLDLMGLSGASTFAALGPLVGIIGALVVAGAAVAPAVGAATLGIGAFGAVAIPNYMAASQAASAVQNAQIAYNAAVANGTKQATAYKTEQIAIAKAYAQLSPAQIALSREIGNAQNAWQSFVQANTAGVSQILTQGIGLLPRVFSILQQLIGPGERAVSGLITAISQGLNSSGFRQFMQVMTSMVVPATQAITRLAFTILGILGNALEQLAPLSVPFIGVLNALLKALGGPVVAALRVVITLFLGLATAIEPLLPGLSRIATMLVDDIGSSFQGFVPILQQVVQLLGTTFLQVLQDLLPIIANALTQNSPFMVALALLPGLLRAVMPAITAVAGLLRNPMFAQLAVDVLSAVTAGKALIGILGLLRPAFALLGVTIEATPIGWILTAIAAVIFIFYELWTHCAAFREFWKHLWREIQVSVAPVVAFVKAEIAELTAWWNAHWTEIREVLRIAWALIGGYVKIWLTIVSTEIRVAMVVIAAVWRIWWGLIRDELRIAWDLISGIIRISVTLISGIIGIFLDLVTGHWSKAWHDLQDLTRRLLGEVTQMFGRIAGDWVRLFRDLGHNIMQGLIDGIKAMIGGLLSLIGGIGRDISGTFSSVLHILSPSRVFFEHGRMTLLGYIQGIQAVAPQVRAALAAVGGSVASAGLGGTPGGGTASLGGRVNVTVPVTLMPGTQGYNDPRLLQAIQEAVQEAILRYNVNNPTNGLAISAAGGRL